MNALAWLNLTALEQKLSFTIIGAYAAYFHGVVSSKYLEVDTAVPEAELARWKDALVLAGFSTFYESATYVRLTAPKGAMPIDLVGLNDVAWARLHQEAQAMTFQGVTVPIASARHTIVFMEQLAEEATGGASLILPTHIAEIRTCTAVTPADKELRQQLPPLYPAVPVAPSGSLDMEAFWAANKAASQLVLPRPAFQEKRKHKFDGLTVPFEL